ncbi:MAG: hypothetical protein ACYC1M_11055 [Armatimonadota bacterium]
MKHHLRTLAVLFVAYAACTSHMYAQTLPSSFNYQGRLTDTAGTPLPNGNYQMIFSIWDAVTGGNQLWGSGNKTITLAKGLFTASLGPIPSASLPGANAFLQVQMGTDTPMPRIALGAVPYALKAVELFWPAVASISSASSVLTLTNTAAGPAISAINTGTGRAGTFTINNPNNNTAALLANTNGSGNALHASTTGSGAAIKATPGSGLAGLFEGVIQTNGFKMATGSTNGYVLGSDATGCASWRKDGLALPFTNTTSASGDLFSLKNQGTGKAMWLEIDNVNSSSPTLHIAGNQKGAALLVDGQAMVGGFKMTTGASDGYILSSNALGVGTWKAPGSGFTDISATGTISTLNLNVDPGNANTGTLAGGGIRFGSSSGEGFFSKRDVGGNRYGLDLATNFTPRLSITQSGDVGIGINLPMYRLHVQGAKAGNYATPLSYIENTNSTGDSAPALRLGGSSNSPDGVLNISNFGTGKIAVFGGTGGEMANIDVDGNMSMAGNLSAKNQPAVCFYFNGGYTSWNPGDVKTLETATVKAPSNGYFIVDATFDYGTETTLSAFSLSNFLLSLYATISGSKELLRSSYAYHASSIAEQQMVINWNQPANMGQVITFQLEGDYNRYSNAPFWHRGSTLRVLFVPNILGQ